ncbi:MAG: hypothetical protein B7Z37_18095 [Verrucomicrobia bacterium 12-59-8]|nr:MAG: hypothetical protein B7Z37_18095 [Verrucomicrobia bacterium 12-59-8]
MKIIERRFYLHACVLGAMLWSQDASAYLGGFEEEDGYRIPMNGQILSSYLAGDAQFYLNNNSANGYTGVVPLGAYPNTLGDGTNGPDVTRYNAGQYGTNYGGPGGGAADIADNSGLWQVLSGGRLYEDATAPYYYGSQYDRNQIVAYRNTMPHAGSQTLNLMASDQSLSYRYSLDSRDFGGIVPASTAGLQVQMSFWVKPSDWDDPDTGNILGLSLLDAANQSVFEVGYTGDNLLQYRLTGGAWQTTAYQMGAQGWSEIALVLNTLDNTASLGISAYNDGSSMLGGSSSVLNHQSLGLVSAALTGLQWDLRGGSLDNGAVSYIQSFDDFNFVVTAVTPVPEPGCAVLLILAATLLHAPRRRG